MAGTLTLAPLERSLLDALLDTATGVAVVDLALRYTHFNRALAAMNGTEAHTAVGKTVREVVPHLADTLEPALREVLRTGEAISDLEVVGSGPDLGRTWLEQLRPLRDPAGQICAVAVLIEETTQTRWRARVDAFRVALTDHLRVATNVADIETSSERLLGELLGVSRAFYARMSLDFEHVLIEHDYHEGVPSARGAHRLRDFGKGLEARLRRGETWFEGDTTRFSEADQAPYRALEVQAHAVATLLGDGQLVALYGVHSREPRAWQAAELALLNETLERTHAAVERLLAETALRESEERFRQLAENTEDIYWITTFPERTLLYVSPTVEHVTGLRPDDAAALGRWSAHIHSEDREHVAQAFAANLETGFDETYRFVRSDGAMRPDGGVRWLRDRAFPLRDANNQIYRVLGVTQDVTERRALEDRLRATLDRAARRVQLSDRLRSLDDPEQIKALAAQWLCAELVTERSHYIELEDEIHGVLRASANTTSPETVRRHRLDAYGTTVIQALRRGESVAIDDVRSDPRFDAAERERLERHGVRAALAYPIVRAGRLDSILVAQSTHVRAWSDADTLTINEVAERAAADAERAAVRRALLRSEERFRRTVEDAPIPIIVLASDGEVLECSRTWANLLAGAPRGFSSIEAWLARLDAAQADAWRTHLRAVFDSNTGFNGDTGSDDHAVPEQPTAAAATLAFSARSSDHVVRTWQLSFGTPDVLADGRRWAVGMAVDITDARRRELEGAFWLGVQADLARLDTSDAITQAIGERTRALLDLTHLLFVEVEELPERVTVFYDARSPDAFNLEGRYNLTEFHTSDERDLLRHGAVLSIDDVRAAGRDAASAAQFGALGTQALVTAPYVRDGRWRFALSAHSANARIWTERESRLLSELAAQVYPRLERARTEALLRDSEERYRSLFDVIDEGFCVIEMLFDGHLKPCDYRFLEVNPAFERQSGLSNAAGKTALELVPSLESHWFERYGRVALSGVGERFESASETMGRYFEVYASRVGNPSLYRVAVVFTDITERKRAEISQRENQNRLLEINDAQRRFVSDAAHELRAPLTSIRGNLELLLRHPNLAGEEREEMIRDAEREASRLSRLITDLLALARGDNEHRSEHAPLRLDRLVEEALRSARHLGVAHTLTWDALPSVGVSGDRDRLTQLVLVMLENAFKYTPAPGAVHVSLTVNGDTACLRVRDNGPGIAAADLERVFERFYRADKSRTPGRDPGGTGLGLPIARQIAHAHGGSVHLESEVGMGTTAVVCLPVVKEA
jgi:PAS domain S-box-containing protein